MPTVAEMYSAPVAFWQFALMASTLPLLAASILAGSTLGARAAAALFLSGVLLFVSQLVRVAFGGRLESSHD